MEISLFVWYSVGNGGGTMFYIDYDDLGMEIVAETIQHGGLEPDMRANTFEMTEEVKEALKSGSDSRLYSAMWDIYNDNNSCVAIQSFKNWTEEVNRTEAKRIQKAINRIEANEKALSRCF